MKVFRLCDKEEVECILQNRNITIAGHKCQIDLGKNTHQYIADKNYMHFFAREISLLYLYPSKGKRVCVYNIPEDILKPSVGNGYYLDFINFESKQEVVEYAVESEKIQFCYLEEIYEIKETLDFDYIPETEELYANLSLMYHFPKLKQKLEKILKGRNVAQSIQENIGDLLMLIPEIKSMIGFEHKHPHHHLDVWNHTLEVIRNLNTTDIELNMAALLHDIGKPFSYQEGEIRHFHGHPEVSCQMTMQILARLGYDRNFIEKVAYLVETHDTVIEPNQLDNELSMVQKRLKLQYADARAHHPEKVAKRIRFLDNIARQLSLLEMEERE